MRVAAKNVISDYFRSNWEIDENKYFEVEYVDASQFLVPERIDLICKLEYIDSAVNRRNCAFARELYVEHIRAFSDGTFTEPGTEEKNTIEKYLDCFNKLISECSSAGFSAEKSVVPVGDDDIILDGSHRTAIAIYFNLPLPIIRIRNVKVKYDYSFFKNRGLKEEYLDYMAYQYILKKEDIFVAFLWPVTDKMPQIVQVDNIINQYAKIAYKKKVMLNKHGLDQLMIHTYGDDPWSGNEEDGFSGIPGKSQFCYEKRAATTVYVLTNSSANKIIKLKEKVRTLFAISNHSVHITDTKQEAIYVGQVVLNRNSIDLLNYGEPFKYPQFVKKLAFFRNALLQNACVLEDYAIDSSSILSMYGLREANDIDYISLFDKLPRSKEYENHISVNQHIFYRHCPDELIYNPFYHMYYRGLKFVSFDEVKSMKKTRGEKKDRRDVLLMARFFPFKLERLIELRIIIKSKLQKLSNRNQVFRFLVSCYRAVRRTIKKK